ncbi:MAG: hypothetical protein R6X02_17150 [Enhygromyxa sp.]
MRRTKASAVLLSLLTLFACDSKDNEEGAEGEGGNMADTETEAGEDEDSGDTADDSGDCELWEGDATYPGDCACASPGEECVQGCMVPDGVQTCAEVCEALGETCVENACDGGTYTGGWTCPAPGEHEAAVAHPCDEPVPAREPLEDSDWGVACCCTRS